MTYQEPEDMYEYMLDQQNESVYFEEPYDPAYEYGDEGECPELPPVDGTYLLGINGWTPVEMTVGYFAASTQGDFDYETDSEFGETVGKWTDPETAKVHIDRSVWFEHRAEAEAYGREFDQLAIWDCANGVEIRL